MAVNNDNPAFSDGKALRRLFISVQASKAIVGAVLSVAFGSFVGRPDAVEALALAGLMAPALLALLGFTRIPLAILEATALAVFAVLIGYLAALTGGVLSPLVVWFALVPAEAALAGGRPAVVRAAIAAALALAVVAVFGAFGMLPILCMEMASWEIYTVSVFVALAQAVLFFFFFLFCLFFV